MIDGAELWVVLDIAEVQLFSDGPAVDGSMHFSAYYRGTEPARIERAELRSGDKRSPVKVTWNYRTIIQDSHLHVELTADMALKALKELR